MDDRDSDRADFSVVHDQRSVIDPDSAKLVVTAALGAAVGAAVAYCISSFRASGDEAPIRVKGGSTIIELLDGCAEWVDEDGGKRKWRLSRGERSERTYTVLITIENAQRQLTSQMLKAHKVEVRRGPDQWVEFKASAKKTKVTSHDQLNPDTSQVLSHNYNVTNVVVDNDEIYNPSLGTFKELLLLDEGYGGCR